MHVTAGQHSNFTQQLTPRLQQVLKGIQKVTQSVIQPPWVRLPITLFIMQNMKHLLLQKPPSYVTGFERTRLPRTQQEDTLFTITR